VTKKRPLALQETRRQDAREEDFRGPPYDAPGNSKIAGFGGQFGILLDHAQVVPDKMRLAVLPRRRPDVIGPPHDHDHIGIEVFRVLEHLGTLVAEELSSAHAEVPHLTGAAQHFRDLVRPRPALDNAKPFRDTIDNTGEFGSLAVLDPIKENETTDFSDFSDFP
jgi:hypothetical protein